MIHASCIPYKHVTFLSFLQNTLPHKAEITALNIFSEQQEPRHERLRHPFVASSRTSVRNIFPQSATLHASMTLLQMNIRNAISTPALFIVNSRVFHNLETKTTYHISCTTPPEKTKSRNFGFDVPTVSTRSERITRR